MAPLYVLIGRDGPQGAERRKQFREEHLAYLEPFSRAEKILVAGPFTDGSGSLIIFEAASEDVAREQARHDPYVTRGIFESWEVRPFRRVLP
ncbi:MAG: YciI family protein [Deltaproteobacteria bacterium]|nr:YciI family protein [Deltaproteobacteria bacterium]